MPKTLLTFLRAEYDAPALALLKMETSKIQKFVDSLSTSERNRARRDLERIAYHAAICATYLDSRKRRRGHKLADKAAAKAARTIWCKVFGHTTPFRGSHIIP